MTEFVPQQDVTQMLLDWCQGDQHALDQLMPLVYDELRRQAERYMRHERRDHTLQPTALVHEVFLQLIDQNRIEWKNRAQFFGVATQLMRRVVLKHARDRNTDKRGGKTIKIPIDKVEVASEKRSLVDLIALDAALTELTRLDPRQSRIMELRYFGGLTVEEVAECLNMSTATVKRETRVARAWLQSEMTDLRDDGQAR